MWKKKIKRVEEGKEGDVKQKKKKQEVDVLSRWN